MEYVNKNKRYYRAQLLKLFSDKGFSATTDCEIMLLFKDINEEDKEELAKNIIPLIEMSQTEQEAVTKIKQLIKYFYRTQLLVTFTEKQYSQNSKHEIMGFFGTLEPEQKEKVAKQAIPLVESSQTEQEAVTKIKKLIKYHYRTKMCNLFLERDLSIPTESEISRLFKDLKEEEKENLAKKIIPLIESSKTEQEILTKVKQLIEG